RLAVTWSGDKPSVAVLPFANIGDEMEQQYLSDGITDDIITELSRFSSLLVIARDSSFRHRHTSLDVKQVGRELGVRYIVRGSVRRLGPHTRIGAQLMDAITGRHLWAERYDRTIEECFRLQDEVVRSVVATLEHRVADSEVERGERKSPQRWAAYDFVLQARARLARYDNDYVVAEAFLRQAIALEPTLSEAYSL